MEGGFSLIETAITLGLSAGLIGASVLSLQRLKERHTLNAATHRVRLALEEAYLRALKTQTPTVVNVHPHYLEVATPPSSPPRRMNLPESVFLAPHRTTDTRISFYPSLAASPRQVNITHRSLTNAVILSLRGRIRIEWDVKGER